MCNRYGYNNPLAALQRTFSELDHVNWDGLAPNATDLLQIRPTDRAPIVRPVDGGLELAMLRWGIVPTTWRGSVKAWMAQLKGNPLTNARSESVATNSAFREAYVARRCLVPATQYYEWTTDPERPKGRKLMWKFSVPSQHTFAFPGVWDHADTADGPIDSFTLLTSSPGPDQAPYHNRQPVILERGQWADWLDPANDMAPSFKGSGAGTIAAERFIEGAASNQPTLL
jgi:putative SOS response-associated peptidase YedK